MIDTNTPSSGAGEEWVHATFPSSLWECGYIALRLVPHSDLLKRRRNPAKTNVATDETRNMEG